MSRRFFYTMTVVFFTAFVAIAATILTSPRDITPNTNVSETTSNLQNNTENSISQVTPQNSENITNSVFDVQNGMIYPGTVRLKEGRLYFYNISNASFTPISNVDVIFSTLPQSDIDSLTAGIPVASKEALSKLIEDLTS